jgi:hypothetical protein
LKLPRTLFWAFVALTLAGPALTDAEPAPIQGTFRVELTGAATATTAVDPFWSLYPQYAADTAPMVRWTMGLEQKGDWKLQAAVNFEQQYTGWEPTNLTYPYSGGTRTFPVEFHGVQVGDLTYNFHPLEVSVGRNKVHWGPTKNSLIVSDQVPFLDRVTLHFPMGDWALDSLVASPETREGTTVNYTVTTYQVAHRVSWRTEGLEIGFTEQAILDRNSYDASGAVTASGAYSLSDFFPFFTIHQADQRPFNSMTVLDAAWQMTPEWRLSAESGLDDVDARLFGIPDDPIPTIAATIVGLDWHRDRWTWQGEWGNTHYLWGNHDDANRYGKSIYRIFLDNGVQELPLTSPYGPGATWVNWQLTYAGDRLTYDFKGEVWSVLEGVSLQSSYAMAEPDFSKFDVYGRVHFFATLHRGDVSLTTGPQVLFNDTDVTYQWRFQLKAALGA